MNGYFLIRGLKSAFIKGLITVITFGTIACNSNNQNYKNQDKEVQESSLKIPKKIKRSDFNILINYKLSLTRLIDSLGLDEKKIGIFIDKSDLILSVKVDSLILKQYPIVLGLNPIDDKLMEGDRCTPEGEFKILSKNPHQLWTRFILLDYPNNESREKIKEAKNMGLIPKESLPGGGIGMQGVGNDEEYLIDYGVNWTLGNIALKNIDIIEIYDNVVVGTKVVITK